MFGLGIQEILLIFIIAFIFFGPDQLPELARTVGKFVGAFKKATNDIQSEIAFKINMDEEKKALDDKYRELEKETNGGKDEDIN